MNKVQYPQKKKIGLIVDDVHSSKMIYDLVKLSQTSDCYEISHLIIQRTSRYTGGFISKSAQYIRSRGLSKFVSNAAFKVLCKLEATILKKISRFDGFFESYDLSGLGMEIVEVEPKVSPSGLVFRYTDEDIAKMQSLQLNLLVRGGSGILRGEILDICPNGVLSFHHADNDLNRGGPPGFWEVANRVKTTGFIIQRLKSELDGGDVLFKGNVSTSFMYTLNLIRVNEKANPFLHLVIERLIRTPSAIQTYSKKPYSYRLFTIPSIRQQLAYVISTLAIVSAKLLRRLTGANYRWGVAYQFTENWRDVTLWRSRKIPNPPNRFLADPFVIRRNGKHYCFMEDYSYLTKRGHISVYEIADGACRELGTAIEEAFHLSYPFLIEHDGELYMCPESHEANDIRLYRCIDFPLKWELASTLKTGVSAADTNLFRHEGKWWMLTNICSSGLSDHSSELHVFSSENLLSDTWTPHPQNPVVFDPSFARNGGLILSDGHLYRAFQNQGFDLYGESMGVSKITVLNEVEYAEEPQFDVVPEFFDRIEGTHTYNYSGGLLVVDFLEVASKKAIRTGS